MILDNVTLGELIAKKAIPFTGYTLRFCAPLIGAFLDRYMDVPNEDQELSWYLQCADYAISEIKKHCRK